jgi:sterol desaturase/sphingolipid hydroxylase (fatty acid hydroxylase superfamily)
MIQWQSTFVMFILCVCSIGYTEVYQTRRDFPLLTDFVQTLIPIVGGEASGHLIFYPYVSPDKYGAYLMHVAYSWTIAGLLWLAYVYMFIDSYVFISPPSGVNIALEMLYFYICESLLFYGMHRLQHHSWMYKHFHIRHHTASDLTHLDGDILHIVDVVMNAHAMLLPALLCNFVCSYRLNWFVWLTCLFLRQLITMDCHADAPTHVQTILWYLPWYMGRQCHRDHHRKSKRVNYGYIWIWEWIFDSYSV